MRRIAALYASALRALGLLAGAAIAVLALLVSLDIALRNAGIVNFPWLIEVAEYALYLSTLLAAPWVLSLGAHVRVDVLVSHLPGSVARVAEIAMDLTGAAIGCVLAWYGAVVTHDSWAHESMLYKELVVAEWWLLAAVPVCGLLLSIEFVTRIVRALRGAAAPDVRASEGL